MSVRLKLTLSYAGFLMITSTLLLATVWVFLLRYVPDRGRFGPGPSSPTRTDLVDAFTPRAAQALVFLLLIGLVGGWFLAGRMLAPLNRITEATRLAATGSLSHRIRLEGRNDEFRELADAFDTMLARLEARVAEQTAVRGQRLPRAAHPPGGDADAARRRAQGPEPRHRRARRAPAGRQHPGDRAHRGTAAAQPRRATVLHPGARRPVPRSRRRPPRASCRSPRSTASPSRPRATSPRPPAHPRSCCSWSPTSCTTRSSTTCPSTAPCG